MKPITSQVAVKLIKINEKNSIEGFNDLNQNEFELLCTNNIGSHFVEECLNIFEERQNNNFIKNVFEKLKVNMFYF